MKNLIMIFLLGICGELVIAQPSAVKDTPTNELKGKEMVIMYKGNVWHRQNGSSIMVTDATIIAGLKVKADGSVTLPNGSTTKLKEGDFIEEDGNIYRASE